MNIKEAKEQIKSAMTAYFTKDEFGEYEVAPEKQRPVFLMGPPGIGKTAIMEQIAQELNVGLISYSMTHHTRQSALGLPFIVHKEYGGVEYDVSEYTMSEIIASVYDTIEKTGQREGILFLDEVNCVSETLVPVMLQFLQYKIFGRHKLPDGWIVVTAGNPPEYNSSVREYDVATWDRLKRIDVEPNFEVWKEYAYNKRVHPSVITYLEIRKDDFYQIENSVDGKLFVTARGWDDLSTMIQLYERNGLVVDEKLVCQYIQNPTIAKDFAIYYDLFRKYRGDYQIDKILDGTYPTEIVDRAKEAKFDERLAILGIVFDAITAEARKIIEAENILTSSFEAIKNIRARISKEKTSAEEAISREIEETRKLIETATLAGNMSKEKQRVIRAVIVTLQDYKAASDGITDVAKAFNIIKAKFDSSKDDVKSLANVVKDKFENAFSFCVEAFGKGQEMIILVAEVTSNNYTSKFIAKYGCDSYFANSKELLFHERQKELISEIDMLELN